MQHESARLKEKNYKGIMMKYLFNGSDNYVYMVQGRTREEAKETMDILLKMTGEGSSELHIRMHSEPRTFKAGVWVLFGEKFPDNVDFWLKTREVDYMGHRVQVLLGGFVEETISCDCGAEKARTTHADWCSTNS